jgi:hypothetical protein
MVTLPNEEDVTTSANLWHEEMLPQTVTLVNVMGIEAENS